MSAQLDSGTDAATRQATVYVRILDEGTDVWRPVQAKLIRGRMYVLSTDLCPEGERWEFAPGSQVRVKRQKLSGHEVLVAASAV